jgi:hypothetical protein
MGGPLRKRDEAQLASILSVLGMRGEVSGRAFGEISIRGISWVTVAPPPLWSAVCLSSAKPISGVGKGAAKKSSSLNDIGLD